MQHNILRPIGPVFAQANDMDVQKQPGSTNYAEAFDRVLDKGIVLNAHARMSPTGIDVRRSAVVVTACSVITSNRQHSRSPLDSRDYR